MQPKNKAKKTQSKLGKQKKEFSFPLEKENFIIIAIGIAVLVIGYILMAQNSVNDFTPTVVAPILLVAGYCVIIPYGILKKPKSAAAPVENPQAESANVSSSSVSSNIKTS